MSSFDALVSAVAAHDDLDRKAETLLLGLADRIKATSNDQNIQTLARDLRAAAPALAQALDSSGPGLGSKLQHVFENVSGALTRR